MACPTFTISDGTTSITVKLPFATFSLDIPALNKKVSRNQAGAIVQQNGSCSSSPTQKTNLSINISNYKDDLDFLSLDENLAWVITNTTHARIDNKSFQLVGFSESHNAKSLHNFSLKLWEV